MRRRHDFDFDLTETLVDPNYPLPMGRQVKKTLQYDLDYPLPTDDAPDGAHLAYRRGDPEWAEIQARAADWLQVCFVQNGGRLCFWQFTIYFDQRGAIDELRMPRWRGLEAFAQVPDVFARLAECSTLDDVESMLRSYGVTGEESDE